MNHTAKAPALTPAPAELAAFVAATREDIDLNDITGAIQAALDAWGRDHWWRIVREVHGLLARGEDPYDLRAACADPRKRMTRTAPTREDDH